ncbi:DUF2520 domain-containing protein [Microbacterium sp. HA-8]|uniref:DUF2520 domain-containing protein n=1 Tax=Microbacterium sp. HA-8 TaxID=3234200 RepID=UPI0038F7CD2A
MNSNPQHYFARTVVVVGAGRLGRAIARAFATAGIDVTGPLGRGEIAIADIVLLCVPDAEIAPAAAAARARGGSRVLIGHTSGATPLEGLDVDFGLHPLQSFTGDEGSEAFAGIGCAIAGRTADAREAALALATSLGAHPFDIADEQRAAYHAAASIASNYVVTLLDAAEQLGAAAGLSAQDARARLAPLVRSTIENWQRQGPEIALTGPVARGDEVTVGRQRAAVASGAPDLLPVFDVLRTATRALATRGQDAR